MNVTSLAELNILQGFHRRCNVLILILESYVNNRSFGLMYISNTLY